MELKKMRVSPKKVDKHNLNHNQAKVNYDKIYEKLHVIKMSKSLASSLQTAEAAIAAETLNRYCRSN